MKVANKVYNMLNYSNPWTIKKIMPIIENEINIAIKYNDKAYYDSMFDLIINVKNNFKQSMQNNPESLMWLTRLNDFIDFVYSKHGDLT